MKTLINLIEKLVIFLAAFTVFALSTIVVLFLIINGAQLIKNLLG